MGFWSTLGKIAGIAAPIVAAPFTGGGSLAALGGIGASASMGSKLLKGGLEAAGSLGSVLGKQQEGAAKGRAAQGELQIAQDRNALDRYRTEQDAQFTAGRQDLDRKSFENSNRATTAKQALIGALLSGQLDPTSISGGQRSGGLFDAIRSNPDALAAMRNMHGQADKAQMLPMQFTGGNILQAPQLSKLPQIDQGGFLSTLAKIGQLGGALAPHLGGGGGGSAIPSIGVLDGIYTSQLPGQQIGFTPPKRPTALMAEEDDWSNRG